MTTCYTCPGGPHVTGDVETFEPIADADLPRHDPLGPIPIPRDAHPPVGKPTDHVSVGLTCWCLPYRDAKDPKVIVHRKAAHD
jgi:hypothetical protein